MQPNGSEMGIEQWQDGSNRCMGILLDGRTQTSGIRKAGVDHSLLVIVNAHHDVVSFTLPEVPQGQKWTLQLDTNQSDFDPGEGFTFGHEYQVTGRSVLLFELEKTRSKKRKQHEQK
jgi:glycogen operon protein